MNLHEVASVITAVNPNTAATLSQSSGYTTESDGRRTPTYTQTTGDIQVQALSAKELQHLNDLNITGVLRKVYLDGSWESVVRAALKGGDLFEFGGATWLVRQVLESWPDWSAVAVSQQVNPVGAGV